MIRKYNKARNTKLFLEPLEHRTVPVAGVYFVPTSPPTLTTGVNPDSVDVGDVNSDGLTFGKAGVTDKVDLVLNNVVAGVSGVQDPNTFNNLKNGSMGNFGVVGATVSNLKMNVKGM